nr:MAG TPA: hypothetical protein [Caudoviricetes sp.]
MGISYLTSRCFVLTLPFFVVSFYFSLKDDLDNTKGRLSFSVFRITFMVLFVCCITCFMFSILYMFI